MQPRRTQALDSEFFHARANYWPVGVILLISVGLLVWLVASWSPGTVQNILIPNFYLPVIILMFTMGVSSVFLVTLDSRRAIMWGVCVSMLVWLQLQQVFDWKVLLYIVTPFLLSELALTVGKKR